MGFHDQKKIVYSPFKKISELSLLFALVGLKVLIVTMNFLKLYSCIKVSLKQLLWKRRDMCTMVPVG